MANMAMLYRPKDNNPITLLLMRMGKSKDELEPPSGFTFLADERNRLLRDEAGAYLIDNKED